MRALRLAAGQLLRLTRARGTEVRCEAGRVWITEEACGADTWLAPGERTTLEGRGLALLEAHGPATLRLSR